MKNEHDIRDVLSEHLRMVPAPSGLWEGVSTRIHQPDVHSRSSRAFRPVWALAGAIAVVLLTIPVFWLQRIGTRVPSAAARALDLQAYLTPVQNANASASFPAIYRAPAQFESDPLSTKSPKLPGYTIAAQRVARVGGETVKQVVMLAADSAVALFIASPRVRLDAGNNRWVEETLDGVACKRLNCPRLRMVQFPCSKETCVLLCKACSEQAMRTLMSQVTAQSLEFR